MPGGAQTKVAPHGLAPRGIPGCRASDQRPDERGGAGTAQGRGGRSRRPGAAGVPAAPAPRPRRPTTCSNRRLSELARIGLCSSFLTRTGLLSSVHPSLRFPVRASVRPCVRPSSSPPVRPCIHPCCIRPLIRPTAIRTASPSHRETGTQDKFDPCPAGLPPLPATTGRAPPVCKPQGACPGVCDSAGAL